MHCRSQINRERKIHESISIFFKDGLKDPEKITVYQKIKPGMWTFNGVFKLVDG